MSGVWRDEDDRDPRDDGPPSFYDFDVPEPTADVNDEGLEAPELDFDDEGWGDES